MVLSRTRIIASLVLVAACCPGCGGAIAQEVELDQAPSTLAAMLFADLATESVGRVGVADVVDLTESYESLCAWLSDDLITEIASLSPGLTVLEREHLALLVEEHELSQSGFIDTGSAAELGRFRGLDTIVVVELDTYSKWLLLNARAVAVETAEVLSSASLRINPTAVPEKLTPKAASGGTTTDTVSTWSSETLEIEMVKISRRYDRERVNVLLELRNKSPRELRVGIAKGNFGRCGAALTDDLGNSLLPIGDFRGSPVGCVSKSTPDQDFTRLPPLSSTLGPMTFKASEGKQAHGTEYELSLRLVVLAGDSRERRTASMSGRLSE